MFLSISQVAFLIGDASIIPLQIESPLFSTLKCPSHELQLASPLRKDFYQEKPSPI